MDQMIKSGHPSTCGCHLCGLYEERARAIRAESQLQKEEFKIFYKRCELNSIIERLTADILQAVRDAKNREF